MSRIVWLLLPVVVAVVTGCSREAVKPAAQASAVAAAPIPSFVGKEGRYALMVDGAPFLILGAQVNNSSNYPAALPKVWPAIDARLRLA